MKKIFKHKLLRWGVIPVVLIGVWVFLSFSYIINLSGITILEYRHAKSDFSSWRDGELLKGQKVSAEFTSQADNLGIVAVRFNTYFRINEDKLVFRLREKGKPKWVYENTYLVNQFQPGQLFTFGFPVIENSEGKSYQFELESIQGKPKDAISLSQQEPVFVTKHEYPKRTLFNDKEKLREFLFKKTLVLISDEEFLKNSFIYLLPLVFYLLFQIIYSEELAASRRETKKRLKAKAGSTATINSIIGDIRTWELATQKIIGLFIIFILLDVFFIKEVSQIVLTILSVIWIYIITKSDIDSRVSFIIALFFLTLCPFLLLFTLRNIAEKAAIWAFMFLLIGVVQQMWEIRKGKRDSI